MYSSLFLVVQTVVCAVTASCLVSLINRNYTTFCYFYKVAFGFSQEWLRKTGIT